MIAKDLARISGRLQLRFTSAQRSGILEVLDHTLQQGEETWWSLDVLVHYDNKTTSSRDEELACPVFREKGSPVSTFLASVLDILETDSPARPVPVQFLFSINDGYIIRADFIEQRLEFSPIIAKCFSFLSPLQAITGVQPDTCISLLDENLLHAIGAIVLHSPADFQALNSELQNRLRFPWLSPNRIMPRRIAWVQGREDIDCIQRALKTARALGIKLVILDEPGHWLQDPNSPWASLREAFVEVDITPDTDLHIRVTNAVRKYPQRIDGIVTISDVRLPAIARACQILGMPTESDEAYEIAGDKGRTRLLESVGAAESFVLSRAEDLEAYIQRRQQPLRFPLVVKPVVGWCSDCVSKARSLDELFIAVRKASDRHALSANPSTAVVVEPYIDGPEVDANFAILDGEILFSEINDDFPSPADDRDSSFRANFQETQNVMPSGLPQNELDAIRDQLKASILRQGFRSGVFHCEARVRNSRFHYTAKEGAITDLAAKEGAEDPGDPQVYLHEINARPPGYLESVAVMLAYGVDYYALRMLLALGASEIPRLRALSQPFLNGPQFHLSLMIIQQTRAGIMKTVDAAKEFLEKHTDMRHSIVDYYTRKKGGDVLEGPDASALWWIAYFSVVSRESRKGLLEDVEFIQENFEYDVE
ncbi:glutathione synthetase ATP-binding domain-like protein [Lojkania enalia]|uniref:Glutathione synthetase ATP-binding domain-like protein n=1 Tax=Lojkania enalia TaxID=147567 RepID=A0A9P4JXC6_9PLEO|nr:glutathione synthetase ATP-binding domain-like protein [Didymosphaeria enalia]